MNQPFFSMPKAQAPTQAESALSKSVIACAAAAFLIALTAGSVALALKGSGEYLSPAAIVAQQEKTTGLYGPALKDQVFAYKTELYRRAQPAIVTLGSSQTLNIRQEDFQASFVNLSGMTLDETIVLAEDLFAGHKPRLVLMGLDLSWFEQKQSPARDIHASLRPGGMLAAVTGETPHIGLGAIMHGDGYSADGSYHHNAVLTGLRPSDDEGFRRSQAQLDQERALSPQALAKLDQLLATLREKSIPVVLFIPPLAPTVGKIAKQDTRLAETREKLGAVAEKNDIALFDFHNAASLSAPDCEFIDGTQGGRVVTQRMLLKMAVDDARLRALAKLAEIGWNIEHYKGRASLLPNETDFLKIGCVKQ